MVTGTLRRAAPVRLEGLTARYGLRRQPVFERVDLLLPAGETTAIVGDNGSGKSTLLRIVAGAAAPSGGRVVGRPRTVGYVPDWFPPHPRLSALAYLTHLGRIAGLTGETARRRGAELLERLGFVGEPGAPVDLLSKGNAQKVAIAQAVLADPELVVLDEPWNGLDLRGQRVLRELAAERCDAGAVVVIADHREAFVSGTAHTTYRMDEGVLTPVDGARPPPVHEPAAPTVLVEVSGLPPERHDLPGVISLGVDDGLLRLEVPRETSDEVLIEVLQRGGSIVRVSTERPA